MAKVGVLRCPPSGAENNGSTVRPFVTALKESPVTGYGDNGLGTASGLGSATEVWPDGKGETTVTVPADIDVFGLAALGMVITDLTGRFRRVNPEFARLVGRSQPELLGMSFNALTSPDDVDRGNARKGLEYAAPVDLVHRLQGEDGTVCWVHTRALTIVGEDGRARVLGTTLDITGRKKAEDALKFHTLHDSLTGLANRALFLTHVDKALREPQRRTNPVAVLVLDLDEFKTVNDSLGHTAGDKLLRSVANRLQSVTRSEDTLARRVEDAFLLPFNVKGTEVPVRVSIGIAMAHLRSGTSEDLLRGANLAMHLAKQNGKSRTEMVRPGMQDEALERLALITDLHQALAKGELEIFYQPIVGARDGAPVGAESLVRWHHPRRGLVPPLDFINVAESTGYIVPLGHWVLREACRQAQAWRRDGTVDDEFYVSVNLSPRQLCEPRLIDDVAQALADFELPARYLVLEVTESTFTLGFDAGLARLQELKAIGLRIALDDYGTGYSSLSRLVRLPIDIVKIDKSFIDQLLVSSEGRALVQSVLGAVHALGKVAIAEGVELAEQYATLRELGCDDIQGYLFSKPMPARNAACALGRLAAGRAPSDTDAQVPGAGTDRPKRSAGGRENGKRH